MVQSSSGISLSQQYDPEKSWLWNLADKIFKYTGLDMRDLEARNGSFFTKDGEDILVKVSEGLKETTKGNTNMKSYYEIYDDLKKNNKTKDTITTDQSISTFDMCILRYFIGNLGLNYYEEKESIESIFNSHWKEIQSTD